MSEPVVGIDLGTSNSVISVMLEGEVIVIPDAQGRRIHPSMVYFFDDGRTLVGADTRPYRFSDPANTVFSTKRLIGRPYDSPDLKLIVGSFPYPVVRSDDGAPRIEIHNELHPPEGIAARILIYLKELASQYLATPITKAILTVPANFDEGQRRATKRAAEMAGLEVLRLVNEPTAAALAYGYGNQRRERVAIYDFGGGTFDITLLELRDNVFEVLSTAGNSYLGGDDFDYRLVNYILQLFEKKHGYDLSEIEGTRQRMRMIAEELKRQLTEHEAVKTQLTEHVPGTALDLDLELTLRRQQFDVLCGDIVDRSLTTCEEALEVAGLQKSEIDHLVLVGGTTRVPLVQQKVYDFLGKKPEVGINPDEVVSIGAAIFGASLLEQSNAPEVANFAPTSASGSVDGIFDDFDIWEEQYEQSASGQQAPLLLDVTPHALGIATVGGVMDILIERNGAVPLERTRMFSTSRDNQTRVVLPVFAGNSRRIEENQQLGVLELTNIPEGLREDVKIEVIFEIDTSGMLSVRATDMRTGLNQSVILSIMGDSEISDYDANDLLSNDA